MTHRKNRELEEENAKLRAERDEWKRLTQANEALHEKRDVTEQKWIALACNHEPRDPYTRLSKERRAELLRERLAAVEAELEQERTWPPKYRCTACQKLKCDGTHVGCPSYLAEPPP